MLSTENADLKSTYLVINESTITIQYCSALVFRINHSKRLFFFQDFFQSLASMYLGLPFSTEIPLYAYSFLDMFRPPKPLFDTLRSLVLR